MAIRLTRVDSFHFLSLFYGLKEKERWRWERLKGEIDMLSKFPFDDHQESDEHVNVNLVVRLEGVLFTNFVHYKTKERILFEII